VTTLGSVLGTLCLAVPLLLIGLMVLSSLLGGRAAAPPLPPLELTVARVAARDEEALAALVERLGGADREGLLRGAIALALDGPGDPLEALEERVGELRLLPLVAPGEGQEALVGVLHADLPQLIERLRARPAEPLPEHVLPLVAPLLATAEAAHAAGESLLLLAHA
jgi:hypothetical protein